MTLLSKRVKSHVLGTPASADKLVYEEKDDSFYMGVGRTSDDKYHLHLAAEHGQQRAALHQRGAARRVDGAGAARARVPLPGRSRRQPLDHPHQLEGARTTSWSKLADADAAKGRGAWRDLVPHNPDVFIEDFKPFDSFIAIEERADGNKHIRLLGNDGQEQRRRVRRAGLCDEHRRQSRNRQHQAALHLHSLTTPTITYEVDSRTGERTVLKRDAGAGLRSRRNMRPSGCGRPRATGPRFRSRWSTRRGSSATAPRRCCNTATAATARRWIRTVRRPVVAAARPRHGLCHRAHPRRPGNGPRLVR